MKTFYDIHMHALNLNHPNLSAYLFKDGLIDQLIDENVGPLARLGLFGAVFASKNFIKKKIIKFLTTGNPSPKDIVGNCLSFFEIPLEYQFLVLEYFMKTGSPNIFNAQGKIAVNGTSYDKIVLCPLVIDFGYKNIAQSIFYNLSPKKPIANQVGDLFYAIRTYYRFNLELKGKKIDLSTEIVDFNMHKHEKLFEIYPFMGLDTRNYELQELETLFAKYFRNFSKTESGETRRSRMFAQMGTLDSNMYGRDIDYSDAFAGIKLYPQLGFDPYPNDPEELKKVRFLYQYCIDKRIPIITHCSDAGFKVGEFDSLTSPEGKWKKVLAEYQELTLNFAHFGSESKSDKRQWRNAIIALTKQYENVYTDISCNNTKPEYYDELETLLNPTTKNKFKYAPPISNPELHKKVLYGSDFSINLLSSKINSYNEYLKAFMDARLSSKNDLCESNPEKFLFGKL